MRTERCSILNHLNLEKLVKKSTTVLFYWTFLPYFGHTIIRYKYQFFFQFLMIIFSHNNQQIVTVTVIVVSCFSHWQSIRS